MPEPVVYGPAFSTYTRSVRLALEEKGVGYRLEEIDIFKGANKTPDYLARQPFGKVPAFEHDGFALYETAAILRYVDEAFTGPDLQPDDARGRARMMQAICIIDAYAYPALIGQIVIQRVVTPILGGTPDEAAIDNAMPQAETTVRVLDGLLDGHAHLAGATLSLADLHLVPILDYVRQTPEGKKLLEAARSLARWWDRLDERASVTRTRPALG